MSEHAAVELSPEAIQFAEWLATGQNPPSELDAARIQAEQVHLAAREPEGVTYREVDAGGVLGIWCEPVDASTDYVLLHTHAGGSVLASAHVDRKLAGHIAKAAGAPVLVLDFRRAPEHKYPAQVDDAEAAFNWLRSEGYEPGNIITIGHSIGGFIAVALALRLRDKQQPLPGAIVSISPWCDLEIANETIASNAETDKILSKELLEFFRDAWIGGTGIEFTDTRINLNRADLSGLPPTLVSWGTYEVLAGEDEEFAARVKDAGIDTATVVVPGGQHSYVYGAGRIPETDAAIAQIGAWVREKTKI
ncbi:esterase [Streptomyces violarus]|uniref:Acetyl esterase/lipase n=1 Tax=Streptomyces violarus TaxID=67380 RepID=A0A7W5F1Q4_9ACTN|nr:MULTISPECIES: alpha/beta hydrolase [Streptomyces]MBB3076608.1 acetyl esterase/lipase [Streptomyces violarus]WRT99398.1 alpha/beta hydrolase [Streptomyces sp. CGMCC 4.1772]GHD32159.1 esterase [Streptomyces violarus]